MGPDLVSSHFLLDARNRFFSMSDELEDTWEVLDLC